MKKNSIIFSISIFSCTKNIIIRISWLPVKNLKKIRFFINLLTENFPKIPLSLNFWLEAQTEQKSPETFPTLARLSWASPPIIWNTLLFIFISRDSRPSTFSSKTMLSWHSRHGKLAFSNFFCRIWTTLSKVSPDETNKSNTEKLIACKKIKTKMKKIKKQKKKQ